MSLPYCVAGTGWRTAGVSAAETILGLLAVAIIDNGRSPVNVTACAGQVFRAGLLVTALVIDRTHRQRTGDRAATAVSADERSRVDSADP